MFFFFTTYHIRYSFYVQSVCESFENCAHCSSVAGENPSSQKEFSYCGKSKNADLSTETLHNF